MGGGALFPPRSSAMVSGSQVVQEVVGRSGSLLCCTYPPRLQKSCCGRPRETAIQDTYRWTVDTTERHSQRSKQLTNSPHMKSATEGQKKSHSMRA